MREGTSVVLLEELIEERLLGPVRAWPGESMHGGARCGAPRRARHETFSNRESWLSGPHLGSDTLPLHASGARRWFAHCRIQWAERCGGERLWIRTNQRHVRAGGA